MRPPFLLCIALLCCSCTPVLAQITVGIAGGANLSFRQWKISSLYPPVDVEYTPGIASQAMLLAEWRGSPAIALRAEAGFQIWRSSDEMEVQVISGSIYRGTVKDDLETWCAATLIKLTPFKNRRLYALTGPSVAAVTLNRLRFKDDLPQAFGVGQITRKPGERSIRTTQYFINIGAGVALPLEKRLHWLLEMRYQYGLSNLSTASTVDARISAVSLNIGLVYAFSPP
ncbi:MAG: hypothetical protein IPH12_02105 [Saprospirales bacterium]|nr:hypothetical protein [Saprospirales bacterium]MBK8921555.1 hypothetical protein [Saprospirales bacterium]